MGQPSELSFEKALTDLVEQARANKTVPVLATLAPPIAGWLFDRSSDAYRPIVFAALLFAGCIPQVIGPSRDAGGDRPDGGTYGQYYSQIAKVDVTWAGWLVAGIVPGILLGLFVLLLLGEQTRGSDYTAFIHLGELVEFGPTKTVFTVPKDHRTEEYLSGKFG